MDKMKRKTHDLVLVNECQYTSQGLKLLLNHLLQSDFKNYQHIRDVPEKSGEQLVIAVIHEPDINYNDILWLKNRMKTSKKMDLLIMCDELLQKILACVFGINCLYISHSAPMNEIKDAIINLMLEQGYKEKGQLRNSQLTGTQSRILMMLAEGYSVSEIARIKNKSAKTISSHKIKLMNKMGIPNKIKSLSLLSCYLQSINIPNTCDIYQKPVAHYQFKGEMVYC